MGIYNLKNKHVRRVIEASVVIKSMFHWMGSLNQ